MMKNLILITYFILFASYNLEAKNLIYDFVPFNIDGSINVVIEIPAGTNEKWEVLKDGSKIDREIKDGKYRVVDYLAYPFNYGFIPQTILPISKGGDGDPLDVIVISSSVERGSVIKAIPLGALIMIDDQEIDTKIIAVGVNSSKLSQMNSIIQLNENYNGLIDIILLWLKNYKGQVLVLKSQISKQETLDYIKKTNKFFLEKVK